MVSNELIDADRGSWIVGSTGVLAYLGEGQKMRFKMIRCLLFAGLCICLMSEEFRLRKVLAANTGRIVFKSLRDGNAEIYVMDAYGGNQKNLTNHPADDRQPDWSPDGTKIAFVSRRWKERD